MKQFTFLLIIYSASACSASFAHQQAANEKAAGQAAYTAGQSPNSLPANTAPLDENTGLPVPQNSKGQNK